MNGGYWMQVNFIMQHRQQYKLRDILKMNQVEFTLIVAGIINQIKEETGS